MTTVRDLIDAIDKGNSQEIEAAFNTVMTGKVSASLDTMRMDLAQSMFKTPATEGDLAQEAEAE